MIRIQVLRNAQTRKRSMRCPAFAPSIQYDKFTSVPPRLTRRATLLALQAVMTEG